MNRVAAQWRARHAGRPGARLRSLAVAMAVCAVSPLAAAHSPIPGIGRFYSGALHPLVVPAQLLALLAVGLLIGQRGLARTPIAIVGFLLALVAGLGFGHLRGDVDTDVWLLGGCAVTALAVVLARPLPRWPVALAAMAAGVGIGLSSAPDGLSGRAHAASLAGTAVGALLLTLWVVAMTEFAQRPWAKVLVRVVGSWIAASALLVLALSWVGPRKAPGAAPVTPQAAVPAPSR